MNAISHDTDFLISALREARRHGLSALSQVIALLHLSRKDDGDYPTRIAGATGVSTAAMTGLLDTLVRLKLIEREAAGDDRRTRRVRITSHGLEVLAKILP